MYQAFFLYPLVKPKCLSIKTKCLHYLSFIALENEGSYFYGDDDNYDDEGEKKQEEE